MNDLPTKPFKRRLIRPADPAAWAGADLLVLSACDSGYLGHAIALARSMEQFAGPHHLLLHIVNPTEGDLARLASLAEELQRVKLHVSAERVLFPVGSSPTTYYACARFILAAELMELSESPVPILTLDADAIAVGELTLDFSDKPEAEICLRRRDLTEEVEDHLRVAAGAVWIRDTPAAVAFMRAVADDLLAGFQDASAKWFFDQRVLYKHVQAATAGARVRNLKSKFLDWAMLDDAIFWAGKGDRKYLDVRYLLLRETFDDDTVRREAARMLHARINALMPEERQGAMSQRLRVALAVRRNLRTAVFVPRLDLPWKREGLTIDGRAPVPAPDTVDLRLWWKRFAMELARSLSDRGADPRVIEIPAWEITPERVDGEDVDLAFIPHRSDIDFASTSTVRRFYMQEYFRHVFVVDPCGWSAASSVYPVHPAKLPPAVLGAWDEYEAAFRSGALASKFGQAASASRADLLARRAIPEGRYIFFPLQVPHDQSIRYFSDVEQDEALDAVHALAVSAGIGLVLKEHPANRGSMKPYRQQYRDAPVTWSEAHVHDLLRHCTGVVTVNSGVGFEALLAGKPVVCFGKSEYDRTVFGATPGSLPDAWAAATAEPAEDRIARYARFVDWFLARHAVDLTRPVSSRHVLDRIVATALAEAEAQRDTARPGADR